MVIRLAASLLLGRRGPRRVFLAAAAACGVAAAYKRYHTSSANDTPLASRFTDVVVPTAALATSLRAAAASVTTAAAASAPEPERSLNWRERCFLAHASLQYNGVAYLSPLDFLRSIAQHADEEEAAHSVAADEVQRGGSKKGGRKRRRVLADSEYRAMVRATPGKRRSSDHLFQDMGANGLISFPEFLLLLSVLSKSSYGFDIAFRAFDRNSDGCLDADEFRRLYTVVSGASASVAHDAELLCSSQRDAGDDCSSQAAAAVTTSLQVHFFGPDSRDTVSAAEFARFADNLQREVLLVEFKAAARGSQTMSPMEFGHAVLRRTRLPGAERRLRLGLLEDRVWQAEGVTADEYRQFFQFLLHMSDLFFALRMFDIAGQSIDQDDFQRAVKAATGQSVPPKLLAIVFALFDVNGDGALSYGEFINLFGHQDGVLTHRSGANAAAAMGDESRWDKYRKCVRKYMLLQQ